MADDPLFEKFRAGVKLLDEYEPHWRDRINLWFLDMASGRWCILGQLYRDYLIGVTILDISGPEYGFSLFIDQPEALFQELRSLWAAEIRRGRSNFFKRNWRRWSPL